MANAILTFHSIDDSGSVVSFPRRLLEELLDGLSDCPVPVVPLAEIRQHNRAVALTFDDGFRNFFTDALPLLESRRMPATVFLVSAYCGLNNSWPGQSKNVPILPLMNWAEVREAAERGVNFGSHTVTHPQLSNADVEVANRELRDSKRRIEDELQRSVTEFAYPYGKVSARDLLSKWGYRIAVTTDLRYVNPDSNPLLLPRLDSYYLKESRAGSSLFEWQTVARLGIRRFLRQVGSRLREDG